MSCQSIIDNPVNISSKICNNDKSSLKRNRDVFRDIFTREEMEYLAKSSISSDAELIDYELNSYSEEKIGFLASHKALVIVAKRPGHKEYVRRSFFVKVMPYDVPSQVEYIEHKGAFRKEVEFFKLVMPHLLKNYKGETWSPRCYLVKKDAIVFEDMKFLGFSNRSRLLDEETIKSATACIARFHASALLAEERLNGKCLNELYPHVFEESEYNPTGRYYTWFVTAINLAIAVAKDLNLDTSNVRQASERIFDVAKPSKNKRNVVGHGDLWSSNMLFDKYGNCNLVDFQLIRYAPLAHDIMQMLYLCTTRDFRERHECQVIKHYYAVLKESLSINDFQGIVPSLEEVLQGVEEQRPLALISAAINYPTIMIDGKVGAQIMNDAGAYEAYFFCDRKPFVDKIMALDKEYELRIKEVVKELVEMSARIDSLPRCS